MNNHRLLFVFILFFGWNLHAYAENALGIVIGDPTGLSGRMQLDSQHSLDGALAYTHGHYSGVHLHATYLWDKARVLKSNEGPIFVYYGLGGRIITIDNGKHDGEVALGARAPIGLLYNFTNPNIEIFGELSAALDVVPETNVDLDIGIGARIRF